MRSDWLQVVREIHSGPAQLVIAVTGGGVRAVASLLSTPGASRSILEAISPYSAAALVHWLGTQPEKFCSDATARSMAMRAYLEAQRLAPAADLLLGLACTASLASDRPKRGRHRAWIAVQTAALTRSTYVELDGTARLPQSQTAEDAERGWSQRNSEEDLVAAAILNELALVTGSRSRIELPLLASDILSTRATAAPIEWQELFAGRQMAVQAAGPAAEQCTVRSVLPGAFHPLHQGHVRMAAVAAKQLGVLVHYELSIFNVDKATLDFIELEQRLAVFTSLAPQQPVWLTRAPTFVEKAQLFPGCTFVVGIDTIERIAEPRYYGGSAERDAAIRRLEQAGCRFLVFGRQSQGQFETLGSLALPPELARLCTAVPEAEFREDVSSTELRRQRPDASDDSK